MKAGLKTKIGYGVGAVGKDMVYALVAGFLMYYFNTVYGISSVFIGVLFMAARIFDAFNDPFMGILVGKTKTKIGKFKPWLIVGTLTNAVVLYFMFAIPDGLDEMSLLIYVSISYFVWGITYTLMDIPYWSMIPNISKPGKDRETMSVIARSCAGFGYALPTALTMTLVGLLGGGNEKQGFQLLALIVAVVFVVAIACTVFMVQETQETDFRSPSVKELLKALVENDQALIVVVAIVIFNASLYLTQNLALYFFQYDIGNVELFGLFGTVGGAVQILSMLLLPPLRTKFTKRGIFLGAIVTAIVGYLLLFTLGMLGIQNIICLCIAAAVIFAGFGLATVLTTVFLADTVDYGEWKSGQRNESVIFSLQTFVVKLASAISVLIAGVGLDVIGLDVDAANQTATTLLGLRCIMMLIPIAGLVLAIIIFRKKYTLTEGKLEDILTQLDKNGE
ncbi:MAG: glycoside-pentoside-hexuronide (GPH):cation symporter [Lachnospiraceae bacterium]